MKLISKSILILTKQIVYGSADYRKILPKNSFINIMDFSSAKQLSNYLKLVSSDKQKYNSYLKWKSSHCVQQTEYRYFCELCEKLNQNLLKTKSHINESQVRVETKKKSRDLIEWWFEGSECQTRSISNSLNVSLNVLQLAIIIFIKLYIRFDPF